MLEPEVSGTLILGSPPAWWWMKALPFRGTLHKEGVVWGEQPHEGWGCPGTRREMRGGGGGMASFPDLPVPSRALPGGLVPIVAGPWSPVLTAPASEVGRSPGCGDLVLFLSSSRLV